MRVTDKVGGLPDLNRFFHAYREYFRESDEYSFHYDRLIAEYSFGAGPEQLQEAFGVVVEKLVASQESSIQRFGQGELALGHEGEYVGIFRTELVLVSFALCLRVPKEVVSRLLTCCELGDSLLDAIVNAIDPTLASQGSKPLFYDYYDALYDCLASSPDQRPRAIHDYLDVWYEQKMKDFAFKDVHLEPDPLRYVGYWCFEVAGVVAALNIEDSSFAHHPHYPKDLVAMYRGQYRSP